MTSLIHNAYKLGRPFGLLKVVKFLSRNHPKILMYHRIANESDEEGITEDQFRKHVEIIKNEFEPMTLKDLLLAKEQGKIPKNCVVITFDDGYEDFAEKAYPILRSAKVPATLFVTTGFVNGDIWLWPDKIDYAIRNTKIRELTLSATNEVLDLANAPRSSWDTIASYCLTLENEEKLTFIERLLKDLKVKLPGKIPNKYQSISWDQIRMMVSEGLDIGSHSISHPVLTKLNDKQLYDELKFSKQVLERELNLSVCCFCYPNGQRADFNHHTESVLKLCGYKYAVTAIPDAMPLRSNWSINRYSAPNNLDSFEKIIYGLSFYRLRINALKHRSVEP